MSKTNSGVHHGLRSPMGDTMGQKVHMPKIAANTIMPGTAPKAAPMQSPTNPKNPSK